MPKTPADSISRGSSRDLRTPRPTRHSPIDPFEQHAELCRGDHHLAVGRRRPYEPAFLQSLGEQTQTLTVPPQHLQQVATPTPKDEEMTAKRVLRQPLLDRSGEPIKPFAHVSAAGRQPHPCTRRQT